MSKLVIISGPSGVGKGTVVNMLKKRYQEDGRKLYVSISCTTRLPREGEIDNVHYFFISEEEFQKRLKENDFIEHNCYGTGKYYGTPKGLVVDYLDKGYDVILEIDINGYKQVKEKYPDCIGIFIMPPSIEDLENRLRKRGTEDEETIQKRLKTARCEMEGRFIYENIIVNEEHKEEEAFQKIYNIINK